MHMVPGGPLRAGGEAQEPGPTGARPAKLHVGLKSWVAVKDFILNYHAMEKFQIMWFLDYGNLIQVP